MRNVLYSVFAFCILLSCSLEEEGISFDASLDIQFSPLDTVTFDTLLSAKRSSTRRLKVLNPNKEAIQFSSIVLGLGNNSDYSVILDGRETNRLEGLVLMGGDSLLILIEVNVAPRNRDIPYLVKDSIIFNWNTNTEHVKLITYAQDGNRRSNELICDEVWTNDRPYIVSDTLVVGPNCELTIEEGTSIYFENDAALFVQGTLRAIGDSANHILFRNARFDGAFDSAPGQWNGIYFLEGSTGNEIRFADIYNGQVGLRVGTPDDDAIPDVQVHNSTIHSMSVAGVLAFTSDVEMINCLVYDCGTYLVGGFAGGNYTYQHCTFSNESSRFSQDEPVVQFSDNIVLANNDLLTSDLSLTLQNSIVWGSGEEELLVNDGGGQSVFLQVEGNIIKSLTEISNNFTSTESNFPGFTNPNAFDYTLDTLAFAKDKGLPLGVPNDLLDNVRDISPDIGAYERIER